MEANANGGEGPQNQATPAWLVAYLNRQGDWLEKTRGNLVVAATIIATMSFQLMSNPPGGVWENPPNCSSGENYDPTCKGIPGTSKLEHVPSKRPYYVAMIISSDVSFTASMILILLVISGFRLRNRFILTTMVMLMVAAVLCISAAFYCALELVHNQDILISSIGLQHIRFWILFSAGVLLIQVLWFLWWLIRMICRCRGSTPPLLPLTSSPAQ